MSIRESGGDYTFLPTLAMARNCLTGWAWPLISAPLCQTSQGLCPCFPLEMRPTCVERPGMPWWGPSSELREEGRCQRTPNIPALRAECFSVGNSALALCGMLGQRRPALDFRLTVHKEGAHFLSAESMWPQSPFPVQPPQSRWLALTTPRGC